MNKITKPQHDKLNAMYRDVTKGYQDMGKSFKEIIADDFEFPVTFEGIRLLTKQLMLNQWGVGSHRQLSNEQINAIIEMWTLKAGKDAIELMNN